MAVNEHFVIVGAQRSGTSYLYQLLAEHPEIEMAVPMRPEPKYFLDDELYSRGIKYYQENYFPGKTGAWLKGEKSTSYFESEKAARRISECLSGAKLVFLLRDPIYRAISNYYFSVRNGFESATMEAAFRDENNRISSYDRGKVSASPFAYLQRGRYVDYLDMYSKYFSQDSFVLLQFEKLMGSARELSLLYRALGVDENFRPQCISDVVNSSNTDVQNYSDLPAGLFEYMQDVFRGSNIRLQKKYGVDISLWGN